MRMGRRQALMAGALLATGAVVGCTPVDPVVTGGPTTPPSVPTPSPPPALAGSLDAAALESALAAQGTTLAGIDGVPEGVAERLKPIIAGHRTHALALSGTQPTQRPTTTPTPAPTLPTAELPKLSGSYSKALTQYREQLAAAETSYLNSARHTTGSTALLWASLATSARMARTMITVKATVTASSPRPPAPLPLVTERAAAQQLVAQLHAIIFGYRTAIAVFGQDERDAFYDDLRARRRSRDQLIAWLDRRSAAVPAPEPAYGLPIEPSTEARARELITTMELALLPFTGQWVASCDDASRASALSWLLSTGRAAVRWGGPYRSWPGWPD